MAERLALLLIEDSQEDAHSIRAALSSDDDLAVILTHTDRLSTGLAHLREEAVDLVLLDLKLPDSEGLQTLARVRHEAPRLPIVVLTASDETALALEAIRQGADDYLVKGIVQVAPRLLGQSIRYALERRRADEAVRRAHAQTDQVLRAIPSILIRVRADETITYWNAIAEAAFGLSAADAMGRSLFAAGIRWDAAVVRAALATCRAARRGAYLEAVAFRHPDGREGVLGVTLVPIANGLDAQGSDLLLFGVDLTERHQAEAESARLQEQLSQAQKLEAIGRFAGEIAHDFNNYLQAILGFAGLIRSRHRTHEALLGDVEEIMQAAERASDMVHQLLAFSRRQPLQPIVVDLNDAVQRALRLLEQCAGSAVRVELTLAPHPLPIRLDPAKFEQILLNLCANARDAMPRGGTLTLLTSAMSGPPDAPRRRRSDGAAHNGVARLSIRDTGTGMEPHVAARIFEPFFTTKPSGKGTGLGLAVVYGLVRQHQGLVAVESAPGQGTTVHVDLPIVAEASAPSPPVPAGEADGLRSHTADGRPLTDAADRGGGATTGLPASAQPLDERPPFCAARPRVLIVDDDPAMLRLCERMLGTICEVTAVSSGQQALQAAGTIRYDLLLCDLWMPQVDGVTVLMQVMQLNPMPGLMAMTGRMTKELHERLQAQAPGVPILHKPFSASALQEAVTRSLAGSGPPLAPPSPPPRGGVTLAARQ
jgi:PAS domain S-box-containing protein